MNDMSNSMGDPLAIDEKSTDQEIVQKALQDIGYWEEYWSDNIQSAHDDMTFLMEEQWTSQEKTELTRLFKPALTFNKLYDVFRKVIGEQRNNTPNLKVKSLSGKASQEDITLRTDIVRSIAYESRNNVVYQTAFAYALGGGYGAYLIRTQHQTPYTFEQVVKYEPIYHPERCFWDPKAKEPTKCDGNFCGTLTQISREEYDKKYPDFPMPGNFNINPLLGLIWNDQNAVVVCDYWVKEYFNFTLLELDNGEAITEEEFKELKKEYKEALIEQQAMEMEGMIRDIPSLPEVLSRSKRTDHKIMHYRLTAQDVIEKTEWPSKHLPMPFVDGDSYYIDGRQYTRSFIKYAIDSQRFLNYLGSDIAAQIKNTRREQWLVTPDNIKGAERMWRQPELQQGALIAKPDGSTKIMPQRLPPAELPQTLLMHYQRATDDIKQILGISDPLQGQPSSVLSGVAVDKHNMQSNSSTSVYFDNLGRAIEQGGRIVLDLLPVIYDTERTLVLSTSDGKEKNVTVNQEQPDGEVKNKLTKGDYDICVETGPSFAIQRNEAVQILVSLMQANPQIAPLVMDIIAQNIDIENAPQLVERFRSIVPPNILAKEEGKQPPPPQPNPQMIQMQMEQEATKVKTQVEQSNVQLKKEKQDQDFQVAKAQLILKAHEIQMKRQDAVTKGEAEVDRSHMDFAIEIAKMLSVADSKESRNAEKDSAQQ